jgi:hypothetical protein
LAAIIAARLTSFPFPFFFPLFTFLRLVRIFKAGRVEGSFVGRITPTRTTGENEEINDSTFGQDDSLEE